MFISNSTIRPVTLAARGCRLLEIREPLSRPVLDPEVVPAGGRASARLSHKFDHITPVLESLHWLPVKYRVTFKLLLLTYKALNGLSPKYISELIQYRPTPRSLRSAAHELLLQPKTLTKTYGDRSFEAAAPRLWNKLPLELRHSKSVDSFKTRLKTYLFHDYFYNSIKLMNW